MLSFIIFLSSLLNVFAIEENKTIINYVTLDGVLHEGSAEANILELHPDLTAWAYYENNINKTGFVFYYFLILSINKKSF
jgi:hypothetical protein